MCFVLAFESLSIAAAVDEPDNSDQQQTIAVKDISGNNNLVFSVAGMEETQDELVYNLSLDFMVENPQGDYKVNPGDKFSFSLPSDIFTAEDTQEAVAIYSESSASFGDIKTEVKGEKIAEYTVKSQVVEVVFCDYIEQVENIQSLFGRIMIKINLMRKALTFEEQKSKWDIQTLEDGTVRSLEIQLPARQTVEWSERTEQFTVSQTDNGENEKTVQFSFNESKDKFPPMEGDTAVIAVGEEWQIESEKIDAEPAEAENAEESEAEKSVVTNYLLVEGNTEPFASYKLENGNLVITFEKEVENIDDISKINGQISLEKIPEPTEEETAKTTEEITTEEVTEPVTEETTETEPTEKPSEAVSNSVSNSDVSLLADDYDIDENGVLIKFTAYNSQAVEQDIYWIDNNDSNNVRPGVDDVREQLYNNVKFTATYTYTENNEEYIGTFTRTLAELGVDKSKVTVTDLGGTGHYIFNVASSGLPSAAKITVEDKTYENIKLTWDYTLDTELYRDQYYYVDVNENTIDRWPGSGGNFGWYFSKSMDYSIDIEVRRGQQAMYGIDEVIADLYHFYYVTNVYVEGELVEDHSAISDLTSRNDIVWGEWDYDTNTFKGTNTFTVKHLPKKFISDLENLGYKLVLKLEFAPGYEDKGYIDYEDNTVTLVNEKVPIKDDNNNYVSAVQDVSKETPNSTYYFWNLPKYDEFGTLVSYQVTEYVYDEAKNEYYSLAELKANGIIDTEYNSNSYQVSYELSEGQHKNDKQGVAVTNGLSGSKEIFFRKEWKDAYRYKNGERPDIYLDLYRVVHVKDEDGNVVEKIENIYLDSKWSFHNDVNYSTCNFGSMPKYDSLGYEIFYYAREKMRINKEIFDYTEVEYKYWGDPSDDLVIDEEHPNWEEYRDIGTEYGGLLSTEKDKTLLREYVENGEKVYLLKERGMFVNKIAANVTIDGKKIWANLPSGFLQADLPEVKFSIYQFIEDTDPGNDEDLNQETPIATLTVTDWSKQIVNGEYNFKISYDGENTNSIDSEGNLVAEPVGADQGRLPKYDDNGELHVYRLREEVIGLNGSNANDIKLVFKQPVINNYAITNGYNPQLGSVSVRKWLDTTPFNDDEEKPTIYFALTRTYKNDEGNVVSDPHFIQVMKIDYKDFVNGVADITFKDLPIYAPNGNYYTYKVAENANKLMQGGYDMTAGNGLLAQDANGKYTVTDDNKDGIVEVDGLIPIKNNDDGTIPDPPARPNSNLTNWATFKNVYNTGDDASLYFGKEWVDNNNKNGSRPKTLTFEIYRSADAQSGQGNAIAETKIGTFTVDLTQYWNQNTADKTAVNIAADSIDMVKDLNISIISASGNSAEWTGTGDFATSKYWLFQLEGLEIYAPNSMPWKYKITEIDTGLNGYNIAIGSDGVQFTYSKGTNSYNTMGNAISKLFKNSIETSYTMWKNWRKDIGDFQNSTNKTGYNIKLDSTLYVAGVQAKPDGTAPDAEQYNVLDLWKTVTSSEFKDILRAYNVQENRSVTINNGATLGAKDAASSIFAEHLPVTVMYNGNVYYLKYYMIESKLSFINSSNATVYYEEFTPTFKLYKEKGKDYPDVSRIGFYLDTQSYILKDTIKDIYEETALNIFEPVVSSEKILDNIHDAGLRSVYTNTQDITTDKSIYPYINFYDGNTKKESTFVNLYGETNLKAEKTWVDDAENIYGTREPNGDGWKIVFNIQYKDKKNPSSSWENFKYGSNAAAITITGENSEDNKSNTVTNLPVLGVLPNEDNTGYDIVEFEYCAREVYNSIVINNEEIYRDIYKAIYDADTQPDAENNLYTSSVTNHMITIELEATKNWEDTYGEITPIDMISPVTFELQYQDTAGQWTSFKTPAKVTLNGEPDDVDQSDLPACYEDIAWHAVWNFVPKVMPGSATTGEGDDRQTIYRIVETSENAYPTDGDTELNKDNTDPTKENAYSITNELTELKIEKVVEKYVDGAVVNDKFIFTISGDMDNINLYYKKYNKGDGAAVQDELAEQGQMVVASGKTNFELSDNQYIVIYGLKKGKTYTITENSGKYTAFYKVNNGTETEGNTASVTIPNSKPADMDYVLFTNKRFGKITINKVDENDKKLNGATFLLEKKVNDSATGTESWEEVERKVTGADGVDGVAVFDKLDLNVNYKITELSSADGYNKLINPIEVYLPLGSDTKGENPLYDTEINGLYYYAEITYTIGNNASLEIPTTGGSGFFNPGILGVSALILVAFFYVIREDRKRRKAKSKL